MSFRVRVLRGNPEKTPIFLANRMSLASSKQVNLSAPNLAERGDEDAPTAGGGGGCGVCVWEGKAIGANLMRE